MRLFLLFLNLVLIGPLAAALPDYAWVGAISSRSAVVSTNLPQPDGFIRLFLSRSSSFENARDLAPSSVQAVDGQQVARFSLEGLHPGTKYYYRIERQGPAEATEGSFQTYPEDAASFQFTFGSCSSTSSDHPVFDTIAAEPSLLHLITGDFHYEDIGTNSPAKFLDAYGRNLASPGWQELMQTMPVAYVWDDHDFGANNSDGTSPSAPAARSIYELVVPHYSLQDSQAIYQSFEIGRVLFILLDTRSYRTPYKGTNPAERTMLGARQKAWLKAQLLRGMEENALIVLVSSSPWISAPRSRKSNDNWGGYALERQEIADFIVENGIHRKLCMLSGDAHMLAIDDGTNNTYAEAHFPVFHAAAIDRNGSVKGGPYSHGAIPGGGQYGLVKVLDDGGDVVEVIWQGKNASDEVLMEHKFEVEVPIP